MFALPAGVRATWGTVAPGDAAQTWTGGQLLLISLAHTIDRWAWPLSAVIVLMCLATAALCKPGARKASDAAFNKPVSPRQPDKESR